MRCLLALALLSGKVAKGYGQGIMNTMAQCLEMAESVTTACCTDVGCNGQLVPTTCASQECADLYRPFYLTCGVVLQTIEATNPDSAGFSSLYESCVSIASGNSEHGGVVDSDISASTLYDFSSSGSDDTSSWTVVLDGVMGGRSSGTFIDSTSSTCSAALLSGTIELTHGGFVNIRTDLPSTVDLSNADGLRVCSKATLDYGVSDGSGDLYKMLLSDGSRNSWQADFQTAEQGAADVNSHDDCDGVVSTIPFSQFWPSHWGQITGAQGTIDASEIDGIGFDISFQTEDGGDNSELNHDACANGDADCQNLNPFGICIQWIQSYSVADSINDGRH